MSVTWKSERCKQDAILVLKRLQDGAVAFNGNFVVPAHFLAPMFKWDPRTHASAFEDILNQAVRKAKEANTLFDCEKLLVEVKKAEQVYLKLPNDVFSLITSISIDVGNTWFSRFFYSRQINESRISFLRKCPREFEIPYVAWSDGRKQNDSLEGKIFVRVRVAARTYVEAIDKAIWDFDLLRGIWNLFMNYGRYEFPSRNSPSNSILRGPFLNVQKIGSEDHIQSFSNSFYFPGLPIPTSLERDFVEILRLERKTRRKLAARPWKDELKEWIVSYCRSLDLNDRNSSFLRLWQTLEMMTLDTRERHEEIPKRVSWLYQDREYESVILNLLAEYRHQAVHRAREIPKDNFDTLLSELRRHVENVLRFYIFIDAPLRSLNDARRLLKTPEATGVSPWTADDQRQARVTGGRGYDPKSYINLICHIVFAAADTRYAGSIHYRILSTGSRPWLYAQTRYAGQLCG